jgi:hypothetical protein
MVDISEEYRKMLQELHETSHPQRQPGEFTVREYADINKITPKQARSELEYLVSIGRIEKPDKRYINSNMTVVYKFINS